MLKLRKTLALITVCAMALTLMAVPAMAEESLAPTLLQYDDFERKSATSNDVNANAIVGYTAKGFASGSYYMQTNDTAGFETCVTNHWLLNSENGVNYLQGNQYTTNVLALSVTDGKRVTTDVTSPKTYVVMWEQYFGANVTVKTEYGSGIAFEPPTTRTGADHKTLTRAGFISSYVNVNSAEALNAPIYPYVYWGGKGVTGMTAIEKGNWYEVVLSIEANPAGTNDVIKLMTYKKGTAPKSSWDVVTEADTGITAEYLMIASALAPVRHDGTAVTNDIMSGKDVRFTDYRVEVFDTATKIDAANAAAVAVTALEAATEETVDDLNYDVRRTIEKLGDTYCADILTARASAILAERNLTPAYIYKAETLQYEDFNYGKYDTAKEPTGRNIVNFADAKTSDAEKGFTSGWYRGDNAELAGSEGWYIYTPDNNQSYQLKTSANAISKITRDVAEANRIDLDKEGIYYITFEQYLDEGTTSTVGAFLTLREDDSSTESVYEHFKIGMKTTNAGLTRMDMYVNPLLASETWGSADRLYSFGKMHEVVVKIVSHPAGTKDEVYAMMYPKGSTPVDWDTWNISMTDKELNGKLDVVSFYAPNVGVADIRFADYNVDLFEDEAVDEFKATETALSAVASKLETGEAVDSEITAAEAQIAKLATECNTKEQWTEILNAYKAQNAVVKAVNSAQITTQEEYNALQESVCRLPGNLLTKRNDGALAEIPTPAGKMKAALQAKLDTIAASGDFAQYIWNATYTEGAGTINKDSVVSVKTNNAPGDVMIIAAYDSDDKLISANTCSGDEITYTVGSASYIKVFTWVSSSLAPLMNAILYVK